MPAHDIIDNRNEKLVDHINQILDSSDRGRFAVGYFFLSKAAMDYQVLILDVRVILVSVLATITGCTHQDYWNTYVVSFCENSASLLPGD